MKDFKKTIDNLLDDLDKFRGKHLEEMKLAFYGLTTETKEEFYLCGQIFKDHIINNPDRDFSKYLKDEEHFFIKYRDRELLIKKTNNEKPPYKV